MVVLFIKFIFILLTHSSLLTHFSLVLFCYIVFLENIQKIDHKSIHTNGLWGVRAYIETQYILLMGSCRFIYEIFYSFIFKESISNSYKMLRYPMWRGTTFEHPQLVMMPHDFLVFDLKCSKINGHLPI